MPWYFVFACALPMLAKSGHRAWSVVEAGAPCRLSMWAQTGSRDAGALSAGVVRQCYGFGQASDGGSERMARPDPVINFAELDA